MEKQHGDPSGRRLARRKALLLSEATAVARALEVLLKRAGVDINPCSQLIKTLTQQEQIQLLRSYGRIESRKRFKYSSSHPLLEGRRLSYLYIDESGKSGPEPPQHSARPVFALGAIALPEEEEDNYRRAADAIKLDFLAGRTSRSTNPRCGVTMASTTSTATSSGS